jgi:mannitol/fructose-specific phosphotransferase system IIA component (Ntr-type)
MHLSVLARLSRVLSDDAVVERLKGAASAQEVISALKAAEERIIAG